MELLYGLSVEAEIEVIKAQPEPEDEETPDAEDELE